MGDANSNTDSDQAALAASHALPRVLSDHEINAIKPKLTRMTLAPAQVFVKEGDFGDCAFLLVEGVVEVVKGLCTPDERSFGVRGPGDIIGEMSLIDPSQPRSASVRTKTAAELLVVTRTEFDALLVEHPALSLQLLRNLSHRLRSSENATIRDLQTKNAALTQAYRELEAAQEKLVEQEVLAHELAQAQRIQLQMLPARLPSLSEVDIGASLLAARAVGGDLYEVIRLSEDRLAFAIGDVSGKGIPAALYMALVSSLLRSEAKADTAPADVVGHVNQHLCERDMDSMFVTLLYCDLNPRTRMLRYVRAGHEHPMLWAGDTPLSLHTGNRAVPLGLMEGPMLDIQEILLPAHATVLLYTDGVTDAINSAAQPFGRARLAEFMTRLLDQPAQAICDEIVAAVVAHQGDMPQFDDVTVIALRMP